MLELIDGRQVLDYDETREGCGCFADGYRKILTLYLGFIYNEYSYIELTYLKYGLSVLYIYRNKI
jgi:hypothetical protein